MHGEMVALVTGGGGFIGHYLVAALVARGRRVRCLVRTPEAARAVRALGAEAVLGDICDPATLSGIASGVDQVYHLAAVGHVAAITEAAYRRFIAVNVEGTRNLLAACAHAPLQCFVHFSSTAAMGLPRVPVVDETTPCQPATPYQRSKRESELVALSAHERQGLPVVIVRPCMVYGPGGKGEFLKICRLVRAGLFPRVSRGPELTPAVHVRDLVQGVMAAAERGRAGQVYLLTGPVSYEMHELRRLILQALGLRRPYPYVPLPLALGAAALFELLARASGRAPIVTRANIASTAYDRVFDLRKARNELGYEPRVPIAEGIAETVAWYRQEGLL